jgi:hypothetical protein
MRVVVRLVVVVAVFALSVSVVAVASAAAAPPAQFAVPTSTVPSGGWTQTVSPTTTLGVHTVKQGEWIYCIARAYKVNPMAIAQASGIPGPYGPSGWYGQGWHGGTCPGCGGCAGTYGWCGGYYPYYSPWNYVWPGQVLQIPAVPWYNIPAGPTCAAQFQPPAGWPPPPPQYPVPTPY